MNRVGECVEADQQEEWMHWQLQNGQCIGIPEQQHRAMDDGVDPEQQGMQQKRLLRERYQRKWQEKDDLQCRGKPVVKSVNDARK